ncbi:spherulation-specific family 4 protein [Kitasatospora sp. NPDC050543]|uniref:spherulation-specific family 4 protein n=1 Tax=Kitasatospora sp. NPDC050543 TaxID=3364054 RepID=UPI0037B4BD74
MTLDTMAAGIPMYVHPGVDSRSWAALATADQPVRWIVLNQANGPGTTEDTALYDAARAVKARGTNVCGYISYEYGLRSGGDFNVFADAATWVARGITSVFLDQVPATEAAVQATGVTILGLRDAGMEYVVLNYGVLPHPLHLDLGDVAVVFEGDMTTYRGLTVPAWVRAHEPERLAHLVYEATEDEATEAVGLARGRGCHNVFATDKAFASGNPWAGIPGYWSTEARTLSSYPARPAPGWTS